MNFIFWILLVIALCGCTNSVGLIDSVNPVEIDESSTNSTTGQPLDEIVLANIPESVQDMTIPFLRSKKHPGSNIVIERLENERSVYSSFYASYQSDELTIYGQLTRPTGLMPERGWPGVVFVHGYIPPRSYQTFSRYGDYVDYLARNGIVVFKIDLRGHGESEGEPGGAYFSGDYVSDMLNAYESLQTLEYVDASNVGLWGHSMAGNLVMRAMAVNPEIPKGVIWAGAVYTYTDMREFGIQDSSYQPSQNPNRGRRNEVQQLFGSDEVDDFWALVAPTSYVSEIDGLIQIHHSVNDDVVSIEYARNAKRIFDEAGGDLELFEYQTGGHNLSSPAFEQAMQRNVDFFSN